MESLNGKTIVIIGASGGMGQAICRALVGKGANLALASNQPQELAALADEMQTAGVPVFWQDLDALNELQVSGFFKAAMSRFKRLDMLLYLPGVSVPGKISETTLEQYRLMMDVNVTGAFLCAKHYLPTVQPEQGGMILLISSMAARRANANAPLYCTAKAALSMFSQAMALQVKASNVRITTLNPGPTDTAFWGSRPVPREKFMQTSDIAEVVLFLLQSSPRIVFHEVSFESFQTFG